MRAGAAAGARPISLGVPALRLLTERPWHVSIGAVAVGLASVEYSAAIVVALAGVGAALLTALRAPRLAGVTAALLLAGAAAGDLRLDAIDRPARRVRDGERVSLRADLLTPARPNTFGESAEARVASGRLRGARLLLRAPRWSPLPRSLDVGQEVSAVGRLRAIDRTANRESQEEASAANASPRAGRPSFDFAAFLRRRGVAAELLVDRVRATGRRRGGLAGVLDAMRRRAERAVAAGLPVPEGALLRGMVLGQDEAIDAATRADFRASGLAHLLAVSGQNVMLLAALAWPALGLAGAGLRLRLLVLAGLICAYVPLAGAGPSLQRAGVMGLAGIAAMVASRPASRWYALLLAAAATLAWNPRAAEDPGWQLSFAAVGGILLVGVPLGRALSSAAAELAGPTAAVARPPGRSGRLPWARLLCLVAEGAAITFAATLATAPLLAYHFGSAPIAGLPANLLALPAVAPAMWLGMLKAALGQLALAGTPSAAFAEPAARILGSVAAPPVDYLVQLAQRFADLPAGQLALPLRSPQAVLGAYVVMGALALLIRHVVRLHEPRLAEAAARWRRLPRSRRPATLAAVAAALVVATLFALRSPAPPDHLTVRFLDVGQGDATLIQHPDGTAVLFDGGPPEAGVARLLRRAGVSRLDLVVATHPSRDHHGGLLDVLRRYPVGTLLDGGDGTSDPAFRAVEREAARRGIRRVTALAPLTLTLAGGDLRIHVLSPPPRPPGPQPEDPNPRAVVAIVSSGDFDLLLSADAESEALLPLDLPDVDAMKVPHHGSSDPGLADVLERLRPELAAIEVGAGNSYGHPAPSTLRALRRAHAATYRTDQDGTVTLTVDRGMRVATER